MSTGGFGPGRKMQRKLLGRAGVLLPPEFCQQRRKDAVENLEAVNQDMVGGTEGDEQLFPRDTGAAVVHVAAALPFPADPAGEAVTLEHPGAPSPEMGKVMPLGSITGGRRIPVQASPRFRRSCTIGQTVHVERPSCSRRSCRHVSKFLDL
jgi:hypothetical protein